VAVDFLAVLLAVLRFGSFFALSRLVSAFRECFPVGAVFVRFCPVSARVLACCVFVAPSVFSWLAVFGRSFGVFSLVVAWLVYLFKAIKKARFRGNFQGVFSFRFSASVRA
jgi:hypothetical protein